MPVSFLVNDKIRTTVKFRAPSGIFDIPKHTKGRVKWADGDKYIVELKLDNGTKIDLQVKGREIEKTGFFAGR